MSLLNDLASTLGNGAGTAVVDLIKDHDIGDLVGKFEKAGLGEIANSWVSNGGNMAISAQQIHAVLGAGPVAEMAQKLGVDPDQAADQIAKLLPQVIDRLTPDGKLPSGGGLLGGLLGGLKL
ncbi:YidB family protein [Phenylobacterium sp.]|uniref:YidB family protein n=1 Tax=Phenylobacterium sp. TaxID=1871053 RepID=UPI0035B0C7F7